jgi:hypothetical protein
VHSLFSKQQTAIDEVDRIASTLNAKADNLDVLSKEMREQLMQMSERFTSNLDIIKGEFSDNIRVLNKEVKAMEIS